MKRRVPGSALSLRVGLAAFLPLIAGCYAATLSLQDAAGASRLVIVPVESPPGMVPGYTRGEALALLIGAGAVGATIHEGVTRGERREVAAQLNELIRDWRMEQALADECAGVLRKQSVRPLEQIRITLPVPLPNAPTLSAKDPGPFVADAVQWKRGVDAALGWRSGPPLRHYQSDPESAGADWALEVGQVVLMWLADGVLRIELQARLLDTASGRILAKGSLGGRSEPPPVEEGVPAARRLEHRYRTATRGLCEQMLADMGMVAREPRR